MSRRGFAVLTAMVSAFALFAGAPAARSAPSQPTDEAALLGDQSKGDNWAGYGRTYGEQHYSPLTTINDHNVKKLGLAWWSDLGVGNPASIPVAVDGVLYYAVGLSVVHAVDAATGKPLWDYDSKVAETDTRTMRVAWGIRGLAYSDGKVYTGTQDGRLIALDAKTGKEAWVAQTTEKGDGRYITGAPRVFNGLVIIGHGGADTSNNRGYVTAYDAKTGKPAWRFFLVPGDPSKGFENAAMEMAAKTWTGKWWKYGGGGAAWNTFTYDAETDTVMVGTGNGAPWNQKIRSPGGGDNLFLCSIVALDGKTGAYKWHYQFNPGETWDYNAAMDMELADLVIDGKPRKVVMEAPKNGFFYVIDRTNGKLISAEKISKVTWATSIDLTTGRPNEVPGARFPNGKNFEMWPSYTGAHSWMPMAFSPKTGLVYIPKIATGAVYSDRGVNFKNWRRPGNYAPGLGDNIDAHTLKDPEQNTTELLAWNPVTQKKAWSVKTVGGWNGGALATAGNLVFHGQIDGRFSAYAADTGKELWQFPAQAGIIAAPITYTAGGKQYVTLLVGMGSSAAIDANTQGGLVFDSRTQAKRVLTFMVGGKAQLPPAPPPPKVEALEDPGYRPNETLSAKGADIFGLRCLSCHGFNAVAGGYAPDLRASGVPQSAETFRSIVHDGAMLSNGMPNFPELSNSDLESLRQYLRSRADDLRSGKSESTNKGGVPTQ